MIIKYLKLHNQATLYRATPGSAGFDLTVCAGGPVIIHPGCIEKVALGICVDLTDSAGALLMSRSSLSKKSLMLANGVGLIDRDYRGELIAAVANIGNDTRLLNPGERIAQLVVLPAAGCDIVAQEVESLEDTVRGSGGFGSTGTDNTTVDHDPPPVEWTCIPRDFNWLTRDSKGELVIWKLHKPVLDDIGNTWVHSSECNDRNNYIQLKPLPQCDYEPMIWHRPRWQ